MRGREHLETYVRSTCPGVWRALWCARHGGCRGSGWGMQRQICRVGNRFCGDQGLRHGFALILDS